MPVHAASERVLLSIYEKSMANLSLVFRGGDCGIHILRVFDNAAFDAQPKFVLEARGGEIGRRAEILPEWLRAIVG